MNRQVVIGSKKVASWAYDAQAACLEIEYVWRSVVRYFEVMPELAAAFEAAPSKGSFLSKHIERNPDHPWQKLTAVEAEKAPIAPEFEEPEPDSMKDEKIFERDRAADRAGILGETMRRRRMRLL